MSAPHTVDDQDRSEGTSANSGINSEDFPAHMSSTKSFCESLMKAGCPGEMCKLDWNQAYKHLAVREEDHKLQVFEFGGRYFGEVMVTFGCSSSAGLFDDLAKLVKEMATRLSGISEDLVNQVLDDVVGCGQREMGQSIDSIRHTGMFLKKLVFHLRMRVMWKKLLQPLMLGRYWGYPII